MPAPKATQLSFDDYYAATLEKEIKRAGSMLLVSGPDQVYNRGRYDALVWCRDTFEKGLPG